MNRDRLKQAKRLLAICTDINGTESRKAECGKPCVFADLAGHIATLNIAVYLNGWDTTNEPDNRYEFCLDNPRYGQSFEKIRDRLLEIKKCAEGGNPVVAHDNNQDNNTPESGEGQCVKKS